ncbi:MAG: TlpA family protein disulfide reductase [Aaplasma endosymbiont of Hyalomma asiaticum]
MSRGGAHRRAELLPDAFTTGKLSGELKVPDKSFWDLDGKECFLRDFRDKVLVIVFWAPWSLDSVTSLQGLKGLDSYLVDKGLGNDVVFLSISDTDASDLQSLQQARSSYGFEAAMYIDNKHELFDYFNVKSVPTAFIVGKDNTVKYRISGYVRWDADPVKEELASIIAGSPQRSDDKHPVKHGNKPSGPGNKHTEGA